MAVRLVGVVAVDLLEDLQGVGLAPLVLVRVVRVIVPDQVPESLVLRQRRMGVHRLEPPGELMGQPEIGAAVAGRVAALKCHCSIRCVLVKLPSYSATCADGKEKTSVLMSRLRSLPLVISR